MWQRCIDHCAAPLSKQGNGKPPILTPVFCRHSFFSSQFIVQYPKISFLTQERIMKKFSLHSAASVAILCLFSLSMPCLSFGQTAPSDQEVENKAIANKDTERKAGDRMALTIKDIEYAFRWCPPGTFMMGSPRDEPQRVENETQHQVTLSRGFWMLETEVTQEMWESVMGRNPSHFKSGKLPVESISWNDCQEYIKKLNELGIAPTGFKFSLPTEAQWEYACRAGTTTAFYFGDTLNREQANFGGGRRGRTSEVGSFPANAWGLRDMHGNVAELCLDWYGNYPSDAATDPTGLSQGSYRVNRGGGWFAGDIPCRSAMRLWKIGRAHV
jgi:formylglycine-generating enzyme required for sulfatase activity